jgi:hypothetical protein
MTHPMWWVLSITNKHNPLARTYELEVDNLLHESWHIEEYLDVKQLTDSP